MESASNPPVATYREILGKIVGMAQYGLGQGLVDRELRNQPAQIPGNHDLQIRQPIVHLVIYDRSRHMRI